MATSRAIYKSLCKIYVFEPRSRFQTKTLRGQSRMDSPPGFWTEMLFDRPRRDSSSRPEDAKGSKLRSNKNFEELSSILIFCVLGLGDNGFGNSCSDRPSCICRSGRTQKKQTKTTAMNAMSMLAVINVCMDTRSYFCSRESSSRSGIRCPYRLMISAALLRCASSRAI
jgi:hypothetical protein